VEDTCRHGVSGEQNTGQTGISMSSTKVLGIVPSESQRKLIWCIEFSHGAFSGQYNGLDNSCRNGAESISQRRNM